MDTRCLDCGWAGEKPADGHCPACKKAKEMTPKRPEVSAAAPLDPNSAEQMRQIKERENQERVDAALKHLEEDITALNKLVTGKVSRQELKEEVEKLNKTVKEEIATALRPRNDESIKPALKTEDEIPRGWLLALWWLIKKLLNRSQK